MFLRPTTSDVDDQTKRPSMFASDRIATNAAAAPAISWAGPVVEKKSL